MNEKAILNELDISILNREKDNEYIGKLNRTVDKVKYLRFVREYTQKECAKMIGITIRQVRRVEKKVKMSS